MNREQIKTLLDEHEVGPIGIDHSFAVLCALMEVHGETHVVFEKRSAKLKSHTGEVSLPGGRIEEGETPKEAAFRETIEELRIDPKHLEIIGEADYLITRGRAVHCFIGIIHDLTIDEIEPEPGEVAYVFTVPLAMFLESEPDIHVLEFKKEQDESFPYELIPPLTVAPFRNIQDRVMFYKDTPKIENMVWGMTAKIMYGVAKLLKSAL